MSEFSARLKDQLSRFNAREARTQLTLGAIAAAMILLVAVIAWSAGGEDGEAPAVGATSERASKLASNPALVGDGAVPDSGPLAGSAARSGAEGETAGDSLGSAPTSLQPITDTQVKVGIAYITDAGSANAAAGFTGVGQVDQRRGWEAVIADINRHPAHGRKVAPVWYAFSENDLTSKGIERIEQEACARWTQDNRVFAVWGGVLGFDTLHACLTKAKVPEIGGGGGFSYSKTYRDYPYLVSPAGAAMDRMAAFEVDQLYEAGYFSKFKDNAPPYTPQKPLDGKPRIGLIRYDPPSYKAGAAAMKARLAAHGLSLCDGCEFEISYSPDNVQEQLDDATEVNAAIQSCKSKGCTHMLFLGSTSGVRITIFFADGAEKQQYRPLLGFNSLDSPHSARDFLGAPSYPQFRQAILVTSDPTDYAARPTAFARCKKIFEDAGEDFSGDEGSNKENQISVWCDPAWYFAGVLQAAGRTLDLESYLHGVATVAPVAAVGTYVMKTKADRHDGAGAIRRGTWFDDCNCFKPITGEIPV